MSYLLDELNYFECEEQNIYLDRKEKASLYKFGTFCDSCNRDYGVIAKVNVSDFSSSDKIYE